MKRRVVITGIGPYINAGKGKDILWDTVINTKNKAQHIPEKFENNYSFKSKYYIPFPKIEYNETGLHKKFEKIIDDTGKIAIICAKTALEDSGYEFYENGDIPFYNKDLNEASIIIGIGIPNTFTAYEAFAAHCLGHNENLLNEMGLHSYYNRMLVPMIMPNSVSGWLSILFGMHGSNYTINTACSSGNYAIGEAYRKIKDNYSDIIIAGGVENYKDNTGTLMRGFDILGTLTKAKDGIPMPFSKQRNGFLFSEGAACVLILEEYNRAMKRNAPIYAEIIGYEANSDATNIVLMDEKGLNISKIFQKFASSNSIDYINTHGTGTMLNDEVESKVIKSIFGNKNQQPLINSTKGILGHNIGASAALEAAVTALSIQNNMVHPNLSVDNIDNLNVAEGIIQKQINTAISTSYGFGGHNSGLLLKKCN